jgi:hypothetical protein
MLEMMITITILMYIVSLALQLPPCVTIYNGCSNIKLMSPVYFGNGAVCPKLSNQQTSIGAKMYASFEINATQYDFEGSLLFKLQRYSGNQYNIDISSTEANENETTHIHILAAWKVKGAKPFVYVVLVEHTKEFTWNEDKLRKLCDKTSGWHKEYSATLTKWRIDDSMVLKTAFNARGLKSNFELSIFISEGERDNYAMRPLHVDLER